MLECPFVYSIEGKTVWDLFERSLNEAIRDIEEHPRGKLFKRLIEFGPLNPDSPESLSSDGEGTLSDPECGSCVEFIFSHMVNRFKGELAELLAIEPCLKLIHNLQYDNQLPSDVLLYWGDMVKERRRQKRKNKESNVCWGNFTKGADGLICEIPSQKGSHKNLLKIHGVIEVKSMALSKKRIIDQINKHILRLNGGVKLGGMVWTPDYLELSNMAKIAVVPSSWKLSREWYSVNTSKGRKLILPQHSEPLIETQVRKLQPNNLWKIQLPWSQESLNEAAYEMTFWYMSQAGKRVYKNTRLPKGWEYMTPEEAGYNAIKMMLYYIPLRYISQRQERLANKLYNVYSFGYALGVDSKEMLWPEDFPHNNGNEKGINF